MNRWRWEWIKCIMLMLSRKCRWYTNWSPILFQHTRYKHHAWSHWIIILIIPLLLCKNTLHACPLGMNKSLSIYHQTYNNNKKKRRGEERRGEERRRSAMWREEQGEGEGSVCIGIRYSTELETEKKKSWSLPCVYMKSLENIT